MDALLNREEGGIIDNYIEEYLNSLQLKGCSETTIITYRQSINRFFRKAGKGYDEINVHDVRRYLMDEGKNNMQSTISTKIATLSSYFKWIEKERLIKENPMKRIETPKAKPSKPKFLTHEEIELVRKELVRNDKLKFIDELLFEVLYSSGIRVSEAVNLNWSDIDFTNKKLEVINGKGGKDRTTMLSTKAIMLLKEYKEARGDNDEHVFRSNYKRRMSKESIERHVKKIGKLAGLNKKLTPHRLRHSQATHLLSAGVPIDVVQVILGHSEISTTRVYAQTSQENIVHHYKRVFT